MQSDTHTKKSKKKKKKKGFFFFCFCAMMPNRKCSKEIQFIHWQTKPMQTKNKNTKSTHHSRCKWTGEKKKRQSPHTQKKKKKKNKERVTNEHFSRTKRQCTSDDGVDNNTNNKCDKCENGGTNDDNRHSGQVGG
jgi:hypothetical protein